LQVPRGIGAVTACAFAEAGATVVLAARDKQALESVAEGIVAAGGCALAVPGDVGDALSMENLVDQAMNTVRNNKLASVYHVRI